MLRDELVNFNKKLDAHLNDKASKYNVKELVQKYVDQFGENGYTGSRFVKFKTSFAHLAEEVQREGRLDWLVDRHLVSRALVSFAANLSFQKTCGPWPVALNSSPPPNSSVGFAVEHYPCLWHSI